MHFLTASAWDFVSAASAFEKVFGGKIAPFRYASYDDYGPVGKSNQQNGSTIDK